MPRPRVSLPRSVHVRGKRYDIQRAIWIGGREYGLIRNLSNQRERYLIFDPQGGPQGELRALHYYPRNQETVERLRVFTRLSGEDSRFPTIISHHLEGPRIAVILLWVHGITLEQYLERIRRHELPSTSVVAAIRMFRNLAHAVGRLNHRLNVVHADIKPANLIVPRESTNLTLIDFGSAWCIERAVKLAGQGDGITWDVYASPEQRSGSTIPSFQSDIFSASVIFYELLTGRIPYGGLGGGAGATMEMLAEFEGKQEPPSRGARKGDLTPNAIWRRVDQIAARGLALRPEQRYQNRDEWLSDIDDVFAHTLRRPMLEGLAQSVYQAVQSVTTLMRTAFSKSNGKH